MRRPLSLVHRAGGAGDGRVPGRVEVGTMVEMMTMDGRSMVACQRRRRRMSASTAISGMFVSGCKALLTVYQGVWRRMVQGGRSRDVNTNAVTQVVLLTRPSA